MDSGLPRSRPPDEKRHPRRSINSSTRARSRIDPSISRLRGQRGPIFPLPRAKIIQHATISALALIKLDDVVPMQPLPPVV